MKKKVMFLSVLIVEFFTDIFVLRTSKPKTVQNVYLCIYVVVLSAQG